MKLLRRAWKNATAEYFRVRYGRERTRTGLRIRVDNITEAQALAIQDLLATWAYLGRVGSSRWTAFYADGDGNFRPRCFVNGENAKPCDIGTPPKDRWKRVDGDEMYMLDFDPIAWALRKTDSKEK